jgi:hypothetical protein
MIQIVNNIQKKILTIKSNKNQDNIIEILRIFADKEKTF